MFKIGLKVLKTPCICIVLAPVIQAEQLAPLTPVPMPIQRAAYCDVCTACMFSFVSTHPKHMLLICLARSKKYTKPSNWPENTMFLKNR